MIEVLRLALKALNAGEHAHLVMNTDGIKDKVRQAIAGLESQEPVALETVYETIIHWDEGGGKRSRRELARRIVALYTTPPAAQPAPVQEPLGYWNAVEGWVELPEEAHKPTAWVYPEALEAFRQGKPWTAYGANGSGPNSDGVERTPLYTTPPAQPAPVQEPVGEVVVESMGVPGSDAMQVRIHFYKEIPPVGSKVYTTPLAAQRQWVRLTESDRRLICFQWQDGNQTATEIIDLVEVKLKERNHG